MSAHFGEIFVCYSLDCRSLEHTGIRRRNLFWSIGFGISIVKKKPATEHQLQKIEIDRSSQYDVNYIAESTIAGVFH
jgi:hypothetical protein